MSQHCGSCFALVGDRDQTCGACGFKLEYGPEDLPRRPWLRRLALTWVRERSGAVGALFYISVGMMLSVVGIVLRTSPWLVPLLGLIFVGVAGLTISAVAWEETQAQEGP